jgi:hypothetical protein
MGTLKQRAIAAFAKPGLRLAQPTGWFDQLAALLARELAPNSRKLRTALRMTTIGTLGAGLVASCHVNNELGTYIVWLLVGAGPMMSVRKAGAFLIAEALALVSSVVMARALAETPWLMLPFLFALLSFSTYLGMIRKLGAPRLLIEVVCLDTFYGVVFAPQKIGWSAAGAFGGSVIAFGTLVLFDNWLWPDRGEGILLELLGASVARDRSRLLEAAKFYLDRRSAPRPPLPPPTSDLPEHMNLLNRAVAEGVSEHRHAILLAAVTRVARIGLEMDRLTVAARQNVPGEIRAMVRPEIQARVEAIAVVLDEFARELPTHIAVGVDKTPPASRTCARSTLDNLSTRIIQVRPAYIGKASSAEIENFATFTDSLAALTGHIERLLDEPPQPPAAAPSNSAVPRLTGPADPAHVRYSMKVGLCVVIGYVVGIFPQRPELNTILTTVIITALPITFVLWPEYAGDSLLPRLRKVIRDTLSLAPGGSAANTEDAIQQLNSGTMRALAEILEVADDAQVEGRTSTVNHNAIVEAAGTLRRIANRLASIATGRIITPAPRLDPVTESAREAVLDAIRRHLQSWLDFFSGVAIHQIRS